MTSWFNNCVFYVKAILIIAVTVGQADVSPSTFCSGELGGLLNCANRRLANIPRFAKLKDKQYNKLDLSINDIKIVPHWAFKNIHAATINLSGNPLVGISPRAFQGVQDILVKLDLHNTGLSVIHWALFSHLSELKVLDLSSNRLFAIQKELLQHLRALTNLDMSWNRIRRLDNTAFSGLLELEVLNLQGNVISTIDKEAFANLKHLQYLFLQKNQLTVLDPKVFSRLENLKELDLSDNELTSIQSDTFKTLSKLKKLLLDENNITLISPNTFNGAYMLNHVSLSLNNITAVSKDAFLGLSRLELLDVSYNNISNLGSNDVCDIANLQRIKELRLTGNPINCSCVLSWVADLIKTHANIVGTCAEPAKFSSLPVKDADFSHCKNEKFCRQQKSSPSDNIN